MVLSRYICAHVYIYICVHHNIPSYYAIVPLYYPNIHTIQPYHSIYSSIPFIYPNLQPLLLSSTFKYHHLPLRQLQNDSRCGYITSSESEISPLLLSRKAIHSLIHIYDTIWYDMTLATRIYIYGCVYTWMCTYTHIYVHTYMNFASK